ncbi:MAG: dTDP-4-dehydrorhamnose reductase [Desulfovibrio sp.]
MSTSQTLAILGGRTGLLGMALTEAAKKSGYNVLPLGRADFDPSDRTAFKNFLQTAKPDAVFNTVAYTAVDVAEDEVETANMLNRDMPAMLAEECAQAQCSLYHYSTDFVFTGAGRSTPFTPEDTPEPSSVYGQSKLDGEKAILDVANLHGAIIRTSWLFGPIKTNFVQKILGFAKDRDQLTVVGDQFGSPTYTPDLASYSLEYFRATQKGHAEEANPTMQLIHIANSGKASWCELAAEAVKLAKVECTVSPITTDEWPAKATRPSYSVLDTRAFTEATNIAPRSWKSALKDYIHLLD